MDQHGQLDARETISTNTSDKIFYLCYIYKLVMPHNYLFLNKN